MNKNTMNSGISRNLRHTVFERDSYTCIFCDRGATDCHHVIERRRGGRNTPQNLVSLCREHHMAIHGEMNLAPLEREELELRALQYISDYDPKDFYDNAANWEAFHESF